MSFSLRNIREIPGDNLAKFTNELSKRLSRFLTRDQINQLEDREDIYIDGQDFDVAVKIHSDLLGTTQFNFDKPYYPPLEPDNNFLRLWIQGVNLGNTMTDWSATNKTVQLYGDPTLVDGAPFDLGIKTGGVKSIALRLNRPTSPVQNDEYIQVLDDGITSLDIAGIATGKSYFIRFKIFSLAQQNGYDRTLFEKIDGPSIQDGVMATVTTDGRLKFTVMRSGVDNTYITAASTIAVDTVYEVWFTFAQSGSVIHIYVNNLDKSLTASTASTWQSDTDNSDLWIGQRGKGPEAGFLYGDLYDFRVYHEKVVSSTEVGYMYTNKWSISNIPFGQVMVANYWATYPDTPSVSSFTSTSFSSSSFTT